LEQGLEPADDSLDSDDRQYEGQSAESQQRQESQETLETQESAEEKELEPHEDDEYLFQDWGGGHKGGSGMRSVTRKLGFCQSPLGIPRVLAGLVTPDREHLPRYILAKIVCHRWFSPVRLQS